MFGRIPWPPLTEAFGDELLDPKAKHASAFRREEVELVAAVQVVVIQEAGQPMAGLSMESSLQTRSASLA